MFKNGITLNRSAWYCRLLDKLWGTKAESFKNFCPLFWLIVGSISILPIYVIAKPLIWILNKILGFKLISISRKDKENSIITLGKIIVYLFMLLLAIIYTFCSSILLIFAIQAFIEQIFIGQVIGLILKIILFLLGAFLIGGIIIYFFYSNELMKDKEKIGISRKEQKILIPYTIISSPIRLPYRWIKKSFKEFYNKSCPLIHWK